MEFGADAWWIFGIIWAAVVAVISFFLRRTINTQDRHDKDINEIKQTYVTKNELREVKNNLAEDIKKTQSDVEEIKEKMLTKQDYYRIQTQTETKLDKMYDLLLKKLNGGGKNE